MRIRKYVILLCFIAIVFYVNTGTGAWFTSSASSSGNTFKTGTLVISSNTSIKQKCGDIYKDVDICNLQFGNQILYTYDVINKKNNIQSSLDLYFKNVVTDNYTCGNLNLFDMMKFDLETYTLYADNQGNLAIKNKVPVLSNATYAALKNALMYKNGSTLETKLNGGTLSGVRYCITANWRTDYIKYCNIWQKPMEFKFQITSQARQVNGQY